MSKSTKTRCIIKNPLIIETSAEHLKALLVGEKGETPLGLSYFDSGKIYLDESMDDREKFLTLVHECFHMFFPDLSEKKVVDLEDVMGEVLWQMVKKLSKK